MTLNHIETEIAKINEKQLTEMVKSIFYKHSKNQIKIGFKPFNSFEGPNIKNYMGVGISFDSQLGNRLQNMAFKIVNLKKHKVAPHNILNIVGKKLYVHYDNNNTLKQNIYVVKDFPINLRGFSIEIEHSQINFCTLLSNSYKNKNDQFGISVDLMYLNLNRDAFRVFEIKAGRNLDTKNADSNYYKVVRLEKFFRPLCGSKSYFATWYNNRGESNNPQGSIFAKLSYDQILIGSAFWKKVLPKDLIYERIIEIYQYIFRDIVKVDQRVQVGYE